MKTLLAFALVLCAAGPARAETQTFLAYDFEFENGSVLPELRVAYETHGNLDPGRDNAILLVHGASGNLHAFVAAFRLCGKNGSISSPAVAVQDYAAIPWN